MSADEQDRNAEVTSGISRREVLVTVCAVATAVGVSVLTWFGREFLVKKEIILADSVNLTYLQVVMVFGTLVCILGVILCIRTARTRFDVEAARMDINIGIARVPALAVARLVALMAFIILPAGAVFFANYHTFEGIHEVRACASCHVMLPMVNDMRDPSSETLAARHYKNKWIAENQCYHCHSDYGLAGDLKAKMTGFRHLARYTTRTYHEPIVGRVRFNNKNCLQCHEGTPKWVAVPAHIEAHIRLLVQAIPKPCCNYRP